MGPLAIPSPNESIQTGTILHLAKKQNNCTCFFCYFYASALLLEHNADSGDAAGISDLYKDKI